MTSRKTSTRRDVITLADLSPRHDVRGGTVKGGNRQRVFGVDSTPDNRRDVMKPKITKDLPPKSTTSVKGGRLLT